MKIVGSFIDCVYEAHLYEQDMKMIRNKLVNRLPDKRICDLANVLIIDTKYDMYAVKIRMSDTKQDGSIDTEKIHKKIKELDFIEISRKDYSNQFDSKVSMNIDDWRNIKLRTDELIPPGSNIIFKMDIDVDSLINSEPIMYKRYMLKCQIYNDRGTDSSDPDAWKDDILYFDTEDEMKDYVKNKLDFLFRVVAAFKMEKLNNDIFVK